MRSDKGPWKDEEIMRVELQFLFPLFSCFHLNNLRSIMHLQVYVINMYLCKYLLPDGSKWRAQMFKEMRGSSHGRQDNF